MNELNDITLIMKRILDFKDYFTKESLIKSLNHLLNRQNPFLYIDFEIEFEIEFDFEIKVDIKDDFISYLLLENDKKIIENRKMEEITKGITPLLKEFIAKIDINEYDNLLSITIGEIIYHNKAIYDQTFSIKRQIVHLKNTKEMIKDPEIKQSKKKILIERLELMEKINLTDKKALQQSNSFLKTLMERWNRIKKFNRFQLMEMVEKKFKQKKGKFEDL